MTVVEASLSELASWLDSGRVTSVSLVAAYLNRIAFYDRHGLHLNSVPVLNPDAFAEARESDRRRALGRSLGPLDGIPYTAKDSYSVRGLTVAAGSPAFADLVASRDAFVIERLRAAGAICLGLTTMPPMACGGMQRGLYGRAESPYNADYLTSAYGSGSSNGSGTATAASFAAFGLGEETWSSGRAPASSNGLVAYTPSRGLLSMRGSWPLYVTMDVVVPHTRSVVDLLAVLDVLVADDPQTRGDFWRVQDAVPLPRASAVRPASYPDLATPDALDGARIGVPRMYVNASPGIDTRPSIMDLWARARADLVAQGAEVVDVDLPAVTGHRDLAARGLIPAESAYLENWPLIVWAWDDFLDANADPALSRLVDVDAALVFPHPPGALPDRYPDDADMVELVSSARDGIPTLTSLTALPALLRGLEEARRIDLEDWMGSLGLDALVFPTAADVAPSDADVSPESNDVAWRAGVRYSNGDLAIRHLGIPTVTVPMGLMPDTRMPVGLTFAGRGYDDNRLLALGYAFEQSRPRRVVPSRTPPLPSEAVEPRGHAGALTLSARLVDGTVHVAVRSDGDRVDVWVDGVAVPLTRSGDAWTGSAPLAEAYVHSTWRGPYGSVVVATAGGTVGDFTVVGGVA